MPDISFMIAIGFDIHEGYRYALFLIRSSTVNRSGIRAGK
jgi:hypothetical protein